MSCASGEARIFCDPFPLCDIFACGSPKTRRSDPDATLLLEARRLRRQRKLDAVEIPERYVTVTNELLGKGGFGAVYMADYNGRNAAVKVSS